MNAQPIEADAVYTTREAACLTKLGHSTVVRLARRGDIDAVRVGRTLRITGAALLAFLRGGGTKLAVNAPPAPSDPIVRRLPRQSVRRGGGA